jgi:flagellar hook-length control protein FliK
MNPILLESKNLLETKNLYNQNVMEQSWNARKIESPFLQMIQNLDSSSEKNEFHASNSSPGTGFSFGSSAEWKPIGSEDSDFQPLNREIEKLDSDDDLKDSIQKQDNSKEEISQKNIDENEEEIEEEEDTSPKNLSEKLNIFSIFSSIGDAISNRSEKSKTVDSMEGKNISKENSSKNNINLKKQETVLENKSKADLEKFEKKVLTSQDIWEKLVDKSDKKSNTSKEELVDSQNSKTNQKKEIKVVKSEAQESQKITEEKKVSLDENTFKKKEISESDKKEVSINNKNGRNSGLEISEKNESIKQTDKSDSGNAKSDIQDNASVKKFLERDERAEIRREVSKWDIQKEKVRQESKNGSESTQTSSVSKEALSSINNSSSSQSFDSGKEQHSNAMRNEFINSLSSKTKASEPAPSSSLTKEEMKANFEKLVQTAKIQIINQGKSQAEIHMNPKDLGRMILKITVNQDKVEGKIMVDSEIVKSAIQADLSQLKEDLKGQGLILESLQIDVDLDHDHDLAQKREGYAWERGRNKESELDQNQEANQNKTYTRENSLLDVVA